MSLNRFFYDFFLLVQHGQILRCRSTPIKGWKTTGVIKRDFHLYIMGDPTGVLERIRQIDIDDMKNWEKAVVILFLKKGFHGYMKMTELTRRIYGWGCPNHVFSGQYSNIMRAVKIGDAKRIFEVMNNPNRVKLRRTTNAKEHIQYIWKEHDGYQIPDWFLNL